MDQGIGRLGYFLVGVVTSVAILLLGSAWKVTFFNKYFVWAGDRFVLGGGGSSAEAISRALYAGLLPLVAIGVGASIAGFCMWQRHRNVGTSPWLSLPAALWPAGESLRLIGALAILSLTKLEMVGPLAVRKVNEALVLESYSVVNILALVGFVWWVLSAVVLSTVTKTHLEGLRRLVSRK